MSKKVKALKGFGRGYEVRIKNKIFNLGEGRHYYEVYEVAGPKMDKPKYFVDEESVRLFIGKNDGIVGLEKQFINAVKRSMSKNERKEIQASKDISDRVNINVVKYMDASFRDTKAKRPEDTDK